MPRTESAARDKSSIAQSDTLDLILAETGARSAGPGRWQGRCPAHDDRSPSLSIAVGNDDCVLLYCFAGCDIESITAALGLEPRDLFADHQRPHSLRYTPRARPKPAPPDHERLSAWYSEWDRASRGHPLLTRYLAARGLAIKPPESLRIGYLHGQPYVLARVTDLAGELRGLHRTFLAPDGSRRLERKLAAGSRISGAAIHLYATSERLAVAEGIETALAAHQMTNWPVWAVISASGMAALELPSNVADVLICADHDKAGVDAARTLSQRLVVTGRRVRISTPPRAGHDWLDELVTP